MTLSLLALALLAAPPAPHPVNVRDMQTLDRLADPAVSPDGRTVVFTVTSTDLDANKRSSSLWRIGADGSGARRLTAAPGVKDVNPRFAPDGKTVYFVSNRSQVYQVWKISLDGGEAEKVTDEPLDVSNLTISPDGTGLAYSMDAFPDCPDAACTKKRLDEHDAKKATGQIFDSMFIRHWDTWSNGTRQHLFVRAVSGGASIDVMKGMDADSPSKPFGGPEEFTFTPDSKGIVFAARNVGRGEPWSTNFDLFLVPADGSAKPKDLTEDNPAWDTHPMFSPDGKTLAYLAQKQPGYESDRFRVMLRPWPNGVARSLTEKWEGSPDEIGWSHDGKSFLATADWLANKPVFVIDAATGSATPVVRDGTSHSPLSAGARFDRILYGNDTMKAPTELFTVKPDGREATRLTHIDDARMAAVEVGDLEHFSFKGAKDDTVHGWIVKPVHFDASKKYPVAFLIHGGPQGSWSNDWHYRWNPELFAARGYVAVMVDFHGSTGYGDAFKEAIRDDWGGAPFVDLQKGLETAVAQHPWMDGTRVCALGASYGGYMINWIEGNWPDRFKCLVAHDGNLDERAAYYMTEELWFPEWEHRGTPWDNPAGYTKHNPEELVSKWKTPILVVHGGRDYRIADAQGFATFTVAQRKGIPSKLLYFPDENHWVLKPQNSVLWYDTVLDWLDQWTKPPTAARQP